MTTIPNLLKLLFSSFPPPPTDDADAALASYVLALDGYDLRDIEVAVKRLIRGEVPAHSNKAFAPTSAVLGAAVIEARNKRLESESRGYVRNQLPPPTVERTDESRARVLAQMQQFTATNGEAERIAEDARREGWAKVNARFDADLAAMPVSDRLKRLGYTTGDSDADGDMGSRAATGGR